MDESGNKLNTVLMTLVCSIVFTIGSVGASLRSIVKDITSESIDSAVVDILGRCFESLDPDTVVFVGESSPILPLNATFSNSMTVVLIENDEYAARSSDERATILHHRLPVFVVVESSKYSAEQLVAIARISGWWNYAGFHIILARSGSSRNISCPVKARESLLTAWKMNVLSSVFLCTIYTMRDGTEAESVLAYTYNPYKGTAPLPWKIVETHVGPERHTWTLFEQTYETDRTSCESIKFENKTMDLNGFKIAATVKPHGQQMKSEVKSRSEDITDLGGSDSYIIKAVWKQLNASVLLKIYDSSYGSGLSFENGTADGMTADLVHNKCDIILNLKYVMKQWNVRFSSVVSTTGVSIVTNHRGWKSPLMKIAAFMKIYIILAVVFVCLVTVILTGYSRTISTSPDFMNVLRLMLSSGVSRMPSSMSKRLMVLSTLLLVLVINAVFQGNLAALVTVAVSNRQVNTITDIEELDYDIYGFQFLSEFVPRSLMNRYHDTRQDYIGFCDVLAANTNDSACLVETSQLFSLVGEKNLHISETTLFDFFESYATRKDWPLYERFNSLVMRFVEGGLMLHWRPSEAEKLDMINSSIEQGFRVMRLGDLSFAFEILVIGMTLSAAVFVIEVLVY